ncbi:MAG TPA: hypothetical protein VGO07_02710 [Candidatus Saccharimonadales bacterium]|jgi:hypothetical protein|nr:hypothetical protein [Candidatus Saccharimonadales bacterium]
MPVQPPQPGDKGVYDSEKSSLGLGDDAPGAEGKGLAGKVSETIGQHSGKEAETAETNALQSMNAGIAGIGAKLGKGFTGAAGGGGGLAGAGGTIYKSDNAFAGAGGKLKLIGAVAGSAAKNRKGLLAGGTGASLITILGVLLLGSLPFGFNSIMNGIVDKEMKVVKGNVGEMQDNLASYYIKKYLLPGMKLNGCTGAIVDKSCAVTAKGAGPVSRLFRAWQKGNIEAKWAKQGFEIKYDRVADRYFIRATGQGDLDITKYTHTDDNLFHEIGKSDARALFQEAHKNSSKWDRLFSLFGWGKKTLKSNYRITRCNFTCKVLEAKQKYFTEPIKVRTTAFKIKLFQKVLLPKSEIYSLAFTCLFAGNACDPNAPTVDPSTGEYKTKFDQDIGSRMDVLRAAESGSIKLEKAQVATKELREKGIERYLVEKLASTVIGKLGGGEAAKQGAAKVAGLSVPGLNIVLSVSSIISALSSIGPLIKTTNSALQTFSSAKVFGMDVTQKDEIQSGNVDAAIVGSFNDSFTKGQELQADGKTMGGAGAGATPLYNAVINDGGQTQTAFLNGLFGAKTYAASNDTKNENAYKCPVSGRILDPSGKDGNLICPEQSLKYATFISGAFGSIANFLNLPGINVITGIANKITSISGAVGDFFSGPIVDLVQKIPGYDSVVKTLTDTAAPLFDSLRKYVYPDWINDNMSGATHFVASDMGGRVVANKYGEDVLRGQPLTPEQQYAIETDVNSMDELQFKNKSMYARIFDKEDTHSFVTRLSLAMPTDIRSNTGGFFASLLSDPFGKLMRGFGAIFSGQKAFAAPPKILADPFGITHYGFPLSSPVFHEDPEAFSDKQCADQTHSQNWNAHVTVNPDTGIAEHQVQDPCGILDEGVQLGGGLYDSSLVGQ